MLTSDSPTQKKFDVQGFEDDDHCFVSDDGICSFSYSDHCSYLELVQFLEFLPCVPVTFVTPLSEAEGPYNYVGATGLKQLMQDTGIPSVRHCRKGEKMDMLKNHLAPKRPVEAAENGGGWDEVWMRCLDRAVCLTSSDESVISQNAARAKLFGVFLVNLGYPWGAQVFNALGMPLQSCKSYL